MNKPPGSGPCDSANSSLWVAQGLTRINTHRSGATRSYGIFDAGAEGTLLSSIAAGQRLEGAALVSYEGVAGAKNRCCSFKTDSECLTVSGTFVEGGRPIWEVSFDSGYLSVRVRLGESSDERW